MQSSYRQKQLSKAKLQVGRIESWADLLAIAELFPQQPVLDHKLQRKGPDGKCALHGIIIDRQFQTQ